MTTAATLASVIERSQLLAARLRLGWCWTAIATVVCWSAGLFDYDINGAMLFIASGLLVSVTFIAATACAMRHTITQLTGAEPLYKRHSRFALAVMRVLQLTLELALLCLLANALKIILLQ